MPKSFFTYDQQIVKLETKRLDIADKQAATEKLQQCSYYALIGGYKQIFKDPTTRDYLPGTKFEDIVALYRFDEALREIALHGLLNIERHIRSSLSYSFCNTFGDNQSAYLNPNNYDLSSPAKAAEVGRLIAVLNRTATTRNTHAYIDYNITTYSNVPLWVLVNALTFGTLSKMYEYSISSVKSAVSHEYQGVDEPKLGKILEVLTDFRNVCAHNERLFSHKCARHDIPDLLLHSKMHIPKIGNTFMQGKRDFFSVVIAFRYLLPSEEFKSFKNKLTRLINKFENESGARAAEAVLHQMGFPDNWKKVTSFKVC